MHKVFKSLGIRFCAAVTAGALLTASLVAGAAGGDRYAEITNNSAFLVTEQADSDIEITFNGKFAMTGQDTASTWFVRCTSADTTIDLKADSVTLNFYSYGGTQRVKVERIVNKQRTVIGEIGYESVIQSKLPGFRFADWHKYEFKAEGNNYSLAVDGTTIISGSDDRAVVGKKIWLENYINKDSGALSAAYDNIVINDGGKGYSEDFNDSVWNGITPRQNSDADLIKKIAYLPHPDTAAPDFSNAAVSVAERRSDGFALSWNPASDNVTPAEDIVYKVYASETPVTGPEGLSGLEPAVSVTGETKAGLSGLSADTLYYIAVTAADKAGNTALWYSTDAVSTTAPNTTAGKLTITADVGVAYVLSIPSSADSITSAGDHSLGTLYAETLRLDQNGKLTVSAQYDGLLTRENGGETLAYALKSAAPPAGGEPSPEAFEPIVFTNGSGTGAENGRALYAAVTESDWNAAAAGIYTDTIVFRADYTAE